MGITPQLLNDLLILTTLVVGGSAAVAGFLWLAGFSKDVRTEVARSKWLYGGALCVSIYFVLAWRFLLDSPIILLLLTLAIGPLLFLYVGPYHEKFRRWIFYVVWIYFWIAALIGWRGGWMGVLLVTFPALLVAGLGLFVVAGFLLPFPKLELHRGNHPPRSREGIAIPTFKEEREDFWLLLRHPDNREVRKQWFERQRQTLRALVSYTLGTNYAYYVVIDEKINRRTEGNRTWLTEEEKLVERIRRSI